MTDEAKLYERIRYKSSYYGAKIGERNHFRISPDTLRAICDDFEQRLKAAQTRITELERNNVLMAEQLIKNSQPPDPLLHS